MRPNIYHQDFQEQQRQQAFFNNRRNYQPLNDGFSIADGSQGTVIAVDGQSRADYDRMIKSNFKYTQDNYQEAYKEAARTGKPVVAIFGGFENNNSRQLIENSLPDAKNGAAKDAVYVYIDRAKTKDPVLAKFADGQLAGGHNAAVSLVFSVKPGADGSIQPESPNFRWQGADRSMIASFNQAISEAKGKQESYTGKFNPEALVEKAEKSETGDGTDKKLPTFESARATIAKELKAASESKDWHDAERHFHGAIDAADRFTPKVIQTEQDRIAKALATTPQDSPEFQKLAQDQANLTFVKNAKAASRAALGVACLEWGQTETNPERQQKFREIGSRWIDSAALRDPSLYQNPALIKRIEATGIPADQIESLLPKLGQATPQRDLFQYGGDGKKSDTTPEGTQPNASPTNPALYQYGGDGKKSSKPVQSTKPNEQQKPVQPPKPNEPPTPEEKPDAVEAARKAEEARVRTAKEKEIAEADAAIKKKAEVERFKALIKEDEEKAVKTPEEYYKALQDAADKGLPVIVKIGSTSCGPCHEMAPAMKEQEEALKGKAAVIRVLYENTEDLALSLGADQGVPITKFARPVPNDRNRNGLEEIIPERHKGFVDPKRKKDYSEKEAADTLQYFVNQGMTEWARRKASKR
ncbi:MAG: thioredoxin family protein [Candidatus Obscuribacterales bacterium]